MIAFIPARMNSQRLPGKVLADLGGKPLVQWTIEAAQKADVFARILVSSNDDDVLALASTCRVQPSRRAAALSRSNITVRQLVEHEFGAGPVVILLPTSPFRSAETIRAALAIPHDGVLTVAPMATPQYGFVCVDGALTPWMPDLYELPREKLSPVYRADGGVQIVRNIARWPTRWLAFTPANPIESLDINTSEDLEYARWIVSRSGARPLYSRA